MIQILNSLLFIYFARVHSECLLEKNNLLDRTDGYNDVIIDISNTVFIETDKSIKRQFNNQIFNEQLNIKNNQWNNKKIQFLGYSGNPLEDLKNGFAATGPYYTYFDTNWKTAVLNNIPIVIPIGAKIDFLKEYDWKEVDQQEVESTVKSQIEKYLNLNKNDDEELVGLQPNVFAWYVMPEELRPWRSNEMNYLNYVTNVIKQYSDLPILAYNPFNRNETHLLSLGKNGVEVIAKNAYVTFDWWEDRTKIVKSIQASLNASEKARIIWPEKFVTFGVYLHLAADPIDPVDDANIHKFARHDVFLSVVLGAKVIPIWSLFKRREVRRTYDAQLKAYTSAMREINESIIKLNDTGDISLSEIFLYYEKTLRITDDLNYTHAEYFLNDGFKLVVDVNSSNLSRQLDSGEVLEPFEVHYKLVN